MGLILILMMMWVMFSQAHGWVMCVYLRTMLWLIGAMCAARWRPQSEICLICSQLRSLIKWQKYLHDEMQGGRVDLINVWAAQCTIRPQYQVLGGCAVMCFNWKELWHSFPASLHFPSAPHSIWSPISPQKDLPCPLPRNTPPTLLPPLSLVCSLCHCGSIGITSGKETL